MGKRGPNTFRERELARAYRAARAAGAKAVNVRLTKDGITMLVDLTEEPVQTPANGGESPWQGEIAKLTKTPT
jgi:hypothetical protein